MDFEELRHILQTTRGNRIALFIRHGERENKASVLLTKKGIVQSEFFGNRLKTLGVSIKIYSSPELRCVQTAEIINNCLSGMKNEIVLTNKLGMPGIQILNVDKFQKLYADYNFVYKNIYQEWKKGKFYDILRSPMALKAAAEGFVKSKTTQKGITLFVSQSGTMANIGYSLNIIDYDENSSGWVDYLDGFFVQV